MPQPSAPALPQHLDLNKGEALQMVWRPQFRFFLSKIVFVSGLTTLCLGGIGSMSLEGGNYLIWPASFVISSAFYAFVFDDFLEWPAHKDDVWFLTNQRLIYDNPRDDNAPAFVSFGQIKQVKTWMFWGVRVRLYPRDQVMMLFLPDRTAIRDSIKTAIDNTQMTTPPKGTEP